MLTKVIKRDGTVVAYDRERIVNAIWRAAQAVGGKDRRRAERLAAEVENYLVKQGFGPENPPHVEQIQDAIEKILIERGHARTAKAFIIYRKQREELRKIRAELQVKKLVDDYLNLNDWRVRENSNMGYSLSGLLFHIGTSVIANYTLNKVYPPEVAAAHVSGDFHIHDLGMGLCGYCFDEETRVLTEEGFKYFKDVTLNDKVATLNLETGKLEFQHPIAKQVFDWDGPMYHWKNKSIDLLVTPEHRMLVRTPPNRTRIRRRMEKREEMERRLQKYRQAMKLREERGWGSRRISKEIGIPEGTVNEWIYHGRKPRTPSSDDPRWKFVTASELAGRKVVEFRKNAVWEGEEEVLLPEVCSEGVGGLFKNVDPPAEPFARFLGWYLAEGNCDVSKRGYRISISQLNEQNQRRIAEIVQLLGFKPTVSEYHVSFYSKQLFEYLKKLGRSKEKFIPAEVKRLSPRLLKAFLEELFRGDGRVENGRLIAYYTSSKRLAEDVVECLVKIGKCGSIRRTKDGKYIVYVENRCLTPVFLGSPQVVHYKGKVYDLTVPNGTLLVERNGKLVWSGNCAGWSLEQLLLEGFNGVPAKISSSPPKHLDTALLQMANFIGTLQNEWAGAQAFNAVDVLLAPFVRADGLTYREVKQKIQQFVYNLNISSRWGGQTPFTNVSLSLTVPDDLAGRPAVVGGKPLDKTYEEFKEEVELIDRAFIEVMTEGDAQGRPFTFPIPTFGLTRDFEWDNGISSLLFEMTAKYGLPYFQNFINSDLKPSDVRAMCLHPAEEILIRNAGEVMRTTIGELVEKYAGRFDADGWANPKKSVQVLSVNPETLRVEWTGVKRFLRVKDGIITVITTEDGKSIKVSANHVVPVLTRRGLELKFAKDIKVNDILLTVKSGKEALNHSYQKIGDLILDEKLAGLLGFFTADGNYIFENRKNLSTYGKPKGIQFTFNCKRHDVKEKIARLIEEVFGERPVERKDPRYNTSYLYVWRARLARLLYDAGFRKYGRLPQVLFNSPPSVVEAFLDFFFLGDGCEKEQRIHINDEELARDLLILSFMVGRPACYIKRDKSQKIRFQYKKSEVSKSGYLSIPTLYERIPAWFAKSTTLVPGLSRNRMVGVKTLEKYGAHTKESEKLAYGDLACVRVKEIKVLKQAEQIEFYDIELEKNHLFVHSLGTVTHNCCHLNLDLRELRRNVTGGLFGAGDKTGSVGVVTINMPRIGYLSESEDEFFERLEYLMNLAKISLEIKRKEVTKKMNSGLLPYTKRYLGTLDFHFSTIGLVGMNEACLNLLGCSIVEEEGRNFAIRTLKFMLKKLREFQAETGHLYNLEATPAEGTSYRLARIDKRMYPDIMTAGKDAPYYTNSTCLPVNADLDLWEAIKHQEPLQCLYTGGTVFHTFLGESLEDGESCKNLVRKMAERSRLPYYTITPTYSICPNHGYIAGNYPLCPSCGHETEVYSRVVGYFRPVKNWNEGKQEEFRQRKSFLVG